MDITLELLKDHVETSARIPEPFNTETQITGALVVRDIPSANVESLQVGVVEDVKMANITAITRLASKNVTVDSEMYQLDYQSSESGHRTALRFQLKYAGPKLKARIAGIASNKDDTNRLLQHIVKKQIARIKLENLAREKQAQGKMKPIDISFQSEYLRFTAKHTEYEMVFTIKPRQARYGSIVTEKMPKTIDNIVITMVGENKRTGESSWRMNGAGKPWLVRLAKIIDPAIRLRNR